MANSNVRHATTHDKFVLINALYSEQAEAPATARQLVWTGSHNLVGDSLNKNDETMLVIDDGKICRRSTTTSMRCSIAPAAAAQGTRRTPRGSVRTWTPPQR